MSISVDFIIELAGSVFVGASTQRRAADGVQRTS